MIAKIARRVRQRERGGLNGLQRPIDAGDFVVRATQRPHDQEIVGRLWEHDPLPSAGPDEAPDSERHDRLPKTLGFASNRASQVLGSGPKRRT